MEQNNNPIVYELSYEFKDGDEDCDNNNEIKSIFIQKADNGWAITTIFYSSEELVEFIEVFNTDKKNSDGNKKAIESIIESMGLKNTIKFE